MATTFLMTEKALDDMITQIADTYAKMRNNVQDCMLAAAQYAVLNCNAKPMNKLLAAMPERLRPWLLKHVTQKNVPLVFNKEKGAIAFSFKVAQDMLKAKNIAWESKKDVHDLSDTDKAMLERVWFAAEATLGATMWDSKMQAAKKADKAAKDAAKTQEDKAKAILDSFSRLEKKAKELGVDLPSSTAAPLPKPLEDVVKMLSPVADNNAMMASVVAAIASCLQVNKQAA